MENTDYRMPLTLDNLIGDGDWMIAYVYNNWGDCILMLLPRLDPDYGSKESEINDACMNIGNGSFEESFAVSQWIKEHPGTPFIVSAGGLNDRGDISMCVEIMKANIIGYHNDWKKFVDDSIEFDQWRKVVYYVANTTGSEYELCHNSWKSLINKAEHEIYGQDHKTDAAAKNDEMIQNILDHFTTMHPKSPVLPIEYSEQSVGELNYGAIERITRFEKARNIVVDESLKIIYLNEEFPIAILALIPLNHPSMAHTSYMVHDVKKKIEYRACYGGPAESYSDNGTLCIGYEVQIMR